ncbi:aminopeptidase P family protein [Urechidicola vernalis]|uniref:Xaa-Pro aminopeptidase n=1 Tax=Urechidicola vernalis TaxID=3075600 RepID=A0ABU2Y270_9FLAO|nr:aminopeptidase P family protein [Urechidicola sp. P050]MDT0552132.1 aminopeptidase P family protein [Urechidicola sp. P050]
MNIKSFLTTMLCLTVFLGFSQKDLPTDYLKSDFHKDRREQLRKSMPENSVAVFFANPIRNRANDVDHVYHQDPNFYYLTGYREANSVLLIFSEEQTSDDGTFNELIYVQKRDPRTEQWEGIRLGTEGVGSQLGFANAYNGEDFKDIPVDFSTFDKVMFTDFKNDVRDNKRDDADLYSLIEQFKTKASYQATPAIVPADEKIVEVETNIDVRGLRTLMASLREIKTEEELVLLKKACEISAVGQMEVMKAMNSSLSEREIQGIHEYVYRKYNSEFQGYPSIVGVGNNGCVLHYVENTKMSAGKDLVLMDLGAEYHGYTADVTRTIPANGKFNKEQRAIYDLVYAAQEAGIEGTVVGATTREIDALGRKIINEGLLALGIIDSVSQGRKYFPHGTSHHIGLDVHDLSKYGPLEENMIITVEPGIYIPEGSDCDPKWWGIAVRIEDCILITKDGPINFSGMAPRHADEIEDLMKEESILNAFSLPKLD